uniref:Hexosyltransferase n=1 Tax=Trichuris muris TaxID=70415 RepID=A0A5S6QKD2_TRIMR
MPCIPTATKKQFACLLVLSTAAMCTLMWTERYANKEEGWLRGILPTLQGNICKADRRHQIAMLNQFKGIPMEYTGYRIGVLLTLPYRHNHYYIVQFMTFIYASWKFIQEHAFEQGFRVQSTKSGINLVDLLVFCEPAACPQLPNDCLSTMDPKREMERGLRKPGCYYQPTRQFNHSYPNVNSYAFVNERVFRKMLPCYDYFLRTDIDSFLSPTILNFQMPKRMKIITGKGGYCTPFSTARLHKVARRYGLTHRGVHCLGSTWLGESNVVARLAELTAQFTMRLFDNEFDTRRYPELLPYFTNNIEGTWPDWWRPVSSMYAQELVLNDQIEEITRDYIRGDLLDAESCLNSSILKHVHVHTWHSPCRFNKFAFIDPIIQNLTLNQHIQFWIPDVTPRLATCLSVSNYCTHVAWSGLALVLQKVAETWELKGTNF